MPRPLRPNVPGGVYNIGARGNRRQRIVRQIGDCMRFLDVFGAVVGRHGWRCHAFCLMPNHYHLLVETPETDLSRGMQRLNALYAQWFNTRHELSGHLFQGRFFSEFVQTNEHLLELARYIVLNPVRAGLCSHPADWPWSSYRGTVAEEERPDFLTTDWLLSQFARDPRQARELYGAFVADGAARTRAGHRLTAPSLGF